MDHLDPQPDKYIFLENNSEDDTLEILFDWKRGHPTEIIRLWVREDAVQVLGQKYAMVALVRQMLLDRARNLDVDYAVFVDDDIFIPYTDFVTRITSWKKQLVGMAYPLFSGHHGLCLSPIWINDGPRRETYPMRVRTFCAGFEEVYAVGGGLMCIGKRLLMDRKVNFLPLSFAYGRPFAEDIGYCHKARQHGYKVYVDGPFLLGHYIETLQQKAWHHNAWHSDSRFQCGKKPNRKGVVVMPQKYYELLAEIDGRIRGMKCST